MTVRIALVGLGRWANAHAAAARRSAAIEIAACFTRTADRRRAFAGEHDIPWPAPSYDAILDNPDVDAVVLSTPNDVHVEMSLAALASGKAVLVDKPVAIDVSEGLALLRLPEGHAPIAVAHHARRLAGHRAQKEWIERDEAGDVQLVNATFSNNRGAAIRPDAWHRNVRGSEAGVLIQVGIHQVDNVVHLLGAPRWVNARFAYGELGPSMPITAVVSIAHASGALSTVTSSWTSPSYYRLDVQATGGTMEYWLDHKQWTSPDVDAHAEVWLRPTDGERTRLHPAPGDPMRDQFDALAGAVAAGADPGVSVLDGLQALAVVEAAVQSAAAGGMPIDVASLVRDAGGTPDEIRAISGP